VRVQAATSKLEDLGFKFRYGAEGGARRHRGMRDEAGRALIPLINLSKLYPIAQ
jgi:hypothetical protein